MTVTVQDNAAERLAAVLWELELARRESDANVHDSALNDRAIGCIDQAKEAIHFAAASLGVQDEMTWRYQARVEFAAQLAHQTSERLSA